MAAFLGLLLASGGCTSATFEPEKCADWDGQDPLPPGARSLIGRYVMRVDSFSSQSFGDLFLNELNAREHAQTTFVTRVYELDGHLRMALRGCTWQTDYHAVGLAFMAYGQLHRDIQAAAMPDRDLRLQLGPGCTWSAFPDGATPWGYTPASPAGCVGRPGQRVEAAAEQSWLDGRCVCPAEDAGVPTDPRDCRVTDPDHDGNPGFTISVKGEEYGHVDKFFVLRNLSAFSNGVIDRDGEHVAHERHGETRVSMGCERIKPGSPLGQLASPFLTECEELPDRMPCPEATSRVVLRPIDREMSDAQACQLSSTAFWEFQPSFPAACASEAPESP